MWLFYFLFWTAVTANEEPLYKKIGDKVVLTPESDGNPITNITWKHGNNTAMEWNGNKTFSNQNFKDRGSLDNSTGVMTITGLTPDLSGIYTAEINNKETNETEFLVISPVPKPSLYIWCQQRMSYCVFTCIGRTTGAKPVTYWWTAGDKRWTSTDQHKITKENKEQWFICTLENPVSSNSSEKVFNPFIENDRKWMFVFIPITGVILVICIIFFRRKCRDSL